MLQYLRPDALAFDPHFPWITFPHFATPVIGDAKFDTLDPSTSVIASMPAFALLGTFGVVAAVLPRFGRTRDAAWLRVPLLGALGGIGLTVAISYVAERYLGDWVPLLVLAALIGIQALLRRAEDEDHRRAARRWIVVAAVLAVFGIWVNGGLAMLYARLYAPEHDTDRLALLEVQHSLEVGGPYAVGHSEALPHHPSRAGTTWIVGDCNSMYWSDGRSWSPVQGTAAGGWFRLVVPPAYLSTDWQPLVTDGTAGTGVAVGIRANRGGASAGTVEVGLGRIGPGGVITWPTSTNPVPLARGNHQVNVLLDHALRYVRTTVDGTNAMLARGAQAPQLPPGPFTVDHHVRQLPDAVGLCRDLIGSPAKS